MTPRRQRRASKPNKKLTATRHTQKRMLLGQVALKVLIVTSLFMIALLVADCYAGYGPFDHYRCDFPPPDE